MEIITLNADPHKCLTRQAEAIPDTPEGLAEAQDIIKRLEESLRPRMPAGGLAAPQIGLSNRVFILSWNRAPENLEAVINPSFEPMDGEMVLSWEGCLSVPLAVAQIPRYQNILATYTNREGIQVRYRLEGFAARAFQHEFDHLNGVITIHRNDGVVKYFTTQEERMAFLQEVKKGDQAHYVKPEKIENF